MGGDRFFWYLFGGILLVVGVAFLAATAGVNLFADPNQLDGAPPWVFALTGLLCSVAGGATIYYARKTAARDRRLMQSGVQLTVTVINLQRSTIEINRQTRWHVVYRYEYAFLGEARAAGERLRFECEDCGTVTRVPIPHSPPKK